MGLGDRADRLLYAMSSTDGGGGATPVRFPDGWLCCKVRVMGELMGFQTPVLGGQRFSLFSPSQRNPVNNEVPVPDPYVSS